MKFILTQQTLKRLSLVCITFLLFYTDSIAQPQIILDRYKEYLIRTVSLNAREVVKWSESVQPKGVWADINYLDKEPAEWTTPDHLRRIRAMAILFNKQQAIAFQNHQLLSQTLRALDHWLIKRYRNTNWWHNEIGIPQLMRDITVLLQHQLDPERLKHSLNIIRQFDIKKEFTGGNMIWSTDLGIHYGALTSDTALISSSRNLMLRELVIGNAEGVQSDYSFLQHSSRLQMFHYGQIYLVEGLRLSWQLRNTEYAIPDEKVAILINTVLNGWQWMSRGIYTVPGTIDRAVTRPGFLKMANLRFMIPFMIELKPSERNALETFAQIQDHKNSLSGFRYFPKSDFAAFHVPHFSFFLKTISTRTLVAESINRENLKGRLLNAGNTYLVRNGKEYTDLMPVMNWNALPGLTTFKNAYEIERHEFSGSVSDNKSGLTAMDYQIKDSMGKQKLTARKFWAAHENYIICLIGGIKRSQITDTVFTVLDQSRLMDNLYTSSRLPNNSVDRFELHNLKWIYHDGLTYLPIGDEVLRLRVANQTGTWYDINRSGSKKMITEKVFMPTLIHQPNYDAAGYVLTHTKSLNEVKRIVKHPPWKVLSNTEQSQAVELRDGTLMAAFYAPSQLYYGTGKALKVDRSCLLIVRNNKLFLSDPTHSGLQVTVALDNNLKIVKLPSDGTTVEVDL